MLLVREEGNVLYILHLDYICTTCPTNILHLQFITITDLSFVIFTTIISINSDTYS